eukprot:5837674-Lingulodinium_polyedra.AAC.1
MEREGLGGVQVVHLLQTSDAVYETMGTLGARWLTEAATEDIACHHLQTREFYKDLFEEDAPTNPKKMLFEILEKYRCVANDLPFNPD